MSTSVLIIGAAKSGQVAASILNEECRNTDIIFADDDESKWGTKICGHFVKPLTIEHALNDISSYDAAFVSVGLHKLMGFRERMYARLKGRIPLLNIVHKTAFISESASIGEGNYIGAVSYIGPFAKIGNCNYLSSGSLVEHHTVVGDLNSWGPKCSTSGGCVIGDNVCFGTQIGMVYNISVGSGCSVSSGVVLDKSIGNNKIVRFANSPGMRVSDDKRKARQM